MTYNMTVTVDLPPKENRITLPSGYVYYFTEMKYDPESKRTKDNRKAVGKLCRSDSTKMHPNERYAAIVAGAMPPSDPGSDETFFAQPMPMARHVNVGHYIGLLKAAERVGCLAALKSAFPRHWAKVFAMAAYVIDTSCSTAQLFPYWGYQNYCGFKKPFSDTTISSLYADIGRDDWAIDRFMAEFNKNYQKCVPVLKERIVAFDSTNRNTTCKNNRHAGHGKQKVKKNGVPQVNTALMVDEETGIPLYYENYHGSLLDKAQTAASAERISELGFEKLAFVMDSGYAAKDSIDMILEGSSGFCVMIPDSFNVVDHMMKKYSPTLKDDASRYIWEHDAYGVMDDGAEVFGGKYQAYLFYDNQRGRDEADSIRDKARSLLKAARARKRYSESMAKKFAPYITIEKCPRDKETGCDFTARINDEAIAPEIAKAGYFVVVSNIGKSAGETLRIIRERDRGEKAFERFKSSLDMTASGTHNTLTYEGKTFMAFVALIASESFRWYLKDVIEGRTSTTMETCLGELRNFQMQAKKDGTYMPLTAMTKAQKAIFGKLGMDWNSVGIMIRGFEACKIGGDITEPDD